MTDIIERLLNRALAATIIKDKPDLYNDAADAIIRLCDENEKLRRDVKTAVMGDSAELKDAKKEITRLHAENVELRERLDDIWQGLQTVCGDVRAAIRECK